ncbi:MAG: AAA family ATPase [Planctomycetota bacterium]|jgi:pilus assembly protein CpaE
MRIVLADNRHGRSEELRRILLGEGLTCDADDVVGYDDLPGRLAGVRADLVLVSCNGAGDEALAAIRTAHQITEAPVLAVGPRVTVEAVRRAMRAGAREFLDLDRIREELSEAVVKLGIDARAGHRGQVISLFSPCGGIGTTTTAINLAVRLATGTSEKVALVDLKPAPSDLALLLDVQPQYTTDDVCRQWERMDRRMLQSAMTLHKSGLLVLAQAEYPEDGGTPECTLTERAVRQLFTLIRRICAVTVVDLAHTLDPWQIEAMRLSSFVGLLVRADVPGLRRAKWALDTAAKMGLPRDRFRLVLSRLSGRGQIGAAKVEEILGIKVFQQIPEDSSAVNRAINQGVPLVEFSKRSRISRSFSAFARSVQTSTGNGTT